MAFDNLTFEQLYSRISMEIVELLDAMGKTEGAVTAAYAAEAEADRELAKAKARRDTYEAQSVVQLYKKYNEESQGKKNPPLDIIKQEARKQNFEMYDKVEYAQAELARAKSEREAVKAAESRINAKINLLRAGSMILAAQAARKSPTSAQSLLDELVAGLEPRHE